MNTQQNLQTIQEEMQQAITGTSKFNQLIEQLNGPEMKRDIDAQLYLSWLYLQRGAMKDATQKAFDICQNIAQQTGHPIAYERMADILLWGVGIANDHQQSFQIYQQLANQGRLPLTTLAYFYSHGIGTQKDECIAVNYILKSAAQGDTLAFMLLAHRFEIGLGAPIDGLLSRAFAHLAVKRKFPGAQEKLDQLIVRFASIKQQDVDDMVGSLIQNIENLSDKVNQLAQSMPPNHPEFSRAYNQLLVNNLNELGLDALSFDSDVRGCATIQANSESPHVQTLSDSPVLQVINDFIDFEECQYLIDQALPKLESTAAQMKKKSHTEVDAFSGDSAILSGTQSSPVARIVQQRFADIMNVPVSYFEPVSILKYSVGHDYSLHTDAFDAQRILNHEELKDFGGQRMTTNLIYLLPPIKGGQTHYQAIDYSITGKPGMAIIHHNATADFKADPRSFHMGKEITAGEKWLLRTATRAHPLFGINKV